MSVDALVMVVVVVAAVSPFAFASGIALLLLSVRSLLLVPVFESLDRMTVFLATVTLVRSFAVAGVFVSFWFFFPSSLPPCVVVVAFTDDELVVVLTIVLRGFGLANWSCCVGGDGVDSTSASRRRTIR